MDLAGAIAAVLPSLSAAALAAKEEHDLMLEAADLMGLSHDAANRMRTEIPWDTAEVRRRILMGQGQRWERSGA